MRVVILILSVLSTYFHHPRHMTTGIAVVFKKCFGNPNPDQRISNHVTLQTAESSATIYSLVITVKYDGKPTLHDYNTSFQDLAVDFKRKGLKHLICSPIGCVGDNFNVTDFIFNLKKIPR
ncbi:hypothetical protein J6590_062839 [Homalodisca vitripennis]|nr:hypothetical protein J6590_062839 [Homalodisca vitripennis]